MPRLSARAVPIALFLPLLSPGCSTSPPLTAPSPARTELRDTGQPALHALKNEQLRALMAQLNSLAFEQIRTELELDRERREKTLKIAAAAGDLERAVGTIVAAQPALGLEPTDAATFAALANKLQGQASHLKVLAAQNRIDALPEAMSQLASTCTACHSLFRKF